MKIFVDVVILLIPIVGVVTVFNRNSDPAVLISSIALYLSWAGTYISIVRKFLFVPKFTIETNFTRSPRSESMGQISWFYRLKVSINSSTMVENCSGRMLGFYYSDFENSQIDPLNLFWARQDDGNVQYSALNILGKSDFEYLDLAQYMNSNTHLKLRVSTARQQLSRSEGATFAPVSNYYMKVGLFGENAKGKIVWIEFQLLERENISEMPFEISIVHPLTIIFRKIILKIRIQMNR